jgi:Tol biopolymer transport system component
LSADGRLLAYASDRGATSESEGNLDIWVQQVAGGESLRLTRDAADEREPSFSPDASTIAYRSEQDGGGVYTVSTLGGEPRLIAREGRGARFSPVGDQIAYWTGGWDTGGVVQGKTYVAPAGGGPARQLQPDFHSVTSPLWSPDGQRVLFLGARDTAGLDMLVQAMDWWITPLDGDRDTAVRTGVYTVLREQKFLFGGASAEWIVGSAWLRGRPGESRILFSANSGAVRNTWQLVIDDRTGKVARGPERLTLSARSERAPTAVFLPGGTIRLVFASLSENFDIWSLPLDPDRAVIQGPLRRLTEGEDNDVAPSLSLDGKKLAYSSGGIWLKDLSSGKDGFLANGGNPAISPDGSKVAYHRGAPSRTFVIPASGGGPELVCEGCGWTSNWSHDGVHLLVDAGFEGSLGLVVFGQQKPIPVLQHPSYPLDKGRLSPDGRWIAFHAIPGPTIRRIFVAPFRDPSQSGTAPVEEKEWIRITDGAGMERYAAWSPDGNVLYFLSERDGFRCLRAQRLDGTTKRPVGEPFYVYHFHHARRSLLNAGDPLRINPTVAVDKVAFGLVETTGNIWMAELLP